ncbi:MAG: thiamine diphosphokinase [Oscillospiraceae bacterium]|nr:thiamine diphosphokinase [Oscillospiraceae bacterium]
MSTEKEQVKGKTRCVIISGAPHCVPFTKQSTDYVIACDHGYDHACRLQIHPDLLLGDFDSCLTKPDASIPVLTVPAEKDDTDTLLAARHGLSLGFSEFLFLGATGGRIDHFWANCSVCAFLSRQGARCEMRDKTYTLYTFSHGSLILPPKPHAVLSVYSFCDVSYGVTLRGVKYPLDNYTMTNHFPIGVSNEFTECPAEISLTSGLLMVFVSTL